VVVKYFTNLIPLFGKDNIEAVTISVFIFILRFSKKLQKSAHPSSFILKLRFAQPASPAQPGVMAPGS